MSSQIYRIFFLALALILAPIGQTSAVFSPMGGMGGGGDMYDDSMGGGMGNMSGGGMYGDMSGGMGGSGMGMGSMNGGMMGSGSMGSNGMPSPDLSQIENDITRSVQNVMGKGLAGLYVGLGAGYAAAHGQYYKGPETIGGNPLGFTKVSASGLQLDLYGGLGIIVAKRFYVGGELDVGYNTMKAAIVKFSQGVSVGIAGRAGPVFDDKYMAYFKLGAVMTNYRWNPWGTKSLNFFGFNIAPGLGFEMMLGSRATFRIEGDYGVAVGKKGVAQNVNATWRKIPGRFKIMVGMALKI